MIVSDEPHPDGERPEPRAKVDYFLDRSDALVALCTPDDHLQDGTVRPRQNIIDELQRAWRRDHPATRVQTLKERTVRLPSNINPTFDRLDLDDPRANLQLVLRQLAEWGVLPTQPARGTPAAAPRGDLISGLLDGLSLRDWEQSDRRVLEAFGSLPKQDQRTVVRQLADYLFATDDQTQMHIAAMVIEQAARLDYTLIPISMIERLATDVTDPRRMCAANVLWERSAASPGDVPLDLLLRLAAPTREDWYVFAPALPCLHELVLHRPAAGMLVHALAASVEVEDRREAARVIRGIADVQPTVVDEGMLSWFAKDPDLEVRETIAQAAELVGLSGDERPRVAQAGGSASERPLSPGPGNGKATHPRRSSSRSEPRLPIPLNRQRAVQNGGDVRSPPTTEVQAGNRPAIDSLAARLSPSKLAHPADVAEHGVGKRRLNRIHGHRPVRAQSGGGGCGLMLHLQQALVTPSRIDGRPPDIAEGVPSASSSGTTSTWSDSPPRRGV